MWGQSNRFFQQLKQVSLKLKKPSYKQLDMIIGLFQGCMQSSILISSYEKLIEIMVGVFIASLKILPYEGLYKCYKKLLYCDLQQKNSSKAYILVDCVVKGCERAGSQIQQNELKNILGLVKKAADKHLGFQVIQIFIYYYFQKIKYLSINTQVQIASHLKICSTLFNILYTPKKANHIDNVLKKARKQDNINILILNQYHHLHHLISNSIMRQKLVYSQQILKYKNYLQQLIILFNKAFIITCSMNYFNQIENLSILYPYYEKLSKNYDKQEALYTCMLLQIFKKKQIAEQTGKDKDYNTDEISKQWFHYHQNQHNDIKIRKWIKFVGLFSYYLADRMYPHELFPLINTIDQYSQNSQTQQQYYKLYLDIQMMLHLKTTPSNYQLFIEQSKKPQKLLIDQHAKLYIQHQKNQEKWRYYLDTILEKSLNNFISKDQSDQLLLEQCMKLNHQNKDNWVLMLRILIEYLKKKPHQQQQVLQNFGISQIAKSGLQYFSIRPPSIQKQYSLKSKLDSHILKQNLFVKECNQLLQRMIYESQMSLDEIIRYIKRFLSKQFDKVGQQVIKYLSDNQFFINCLLLTNTTSKLKLLADYIIKKGEMMKKPIFKKQLLKIFKLDLDKFEYVIQDYIQYLANRDKYKFRLNLYEKNLTEFDFLINYNLSNFMLNKYKKQ